MTESVLATKELEVSALKDESRLSPQEVERRVSANNVRPLALRIGRTEPKQCVTTGGDDRQGGPRDSLHIGKCEDD